MLKTIELRIRINEDQYFQIKTKAQLNGFKTISAYVRDKLLRIPHRMEKMILEIYQKLIQTRP